MKRHAWIGILFLAVALPAAADECDLDSYAEAEIEYREALELMLSSCLQAEKNTREIARRTLRTLAATDRDERARALQALTALQEHLGTTYLDRLTSQTRNAQKLNEAIGDARKSILANPGQPRARLREDWQLADLDSQLGALSELDFRQTLAPSNCSIESRNCDTEFEEAADLVATIFLVNAAIDSYSRQYRAEALHVAQLRRSKWDSYYDDLTFQYPWELLLNGWILDADDDRLEIDGNKIGFRELPDSKWTLLHPDANLVYVDEASDEYEVTLTVEAIGYESFGFDDQGKVRNPWGASLLAAYVDRPNGGDSHWTAGVLVKYDGYSLGVTDNDGEATLVFNINLSQRLFEVESDARRYYDEYQGKLDSLREQIQ